MQGPCLVKNLEESSVHGSRAGGRRKGRSVAELDGDRNESLAGDRAKTAFGVCRGEWTDSFRSRWTPGHLFQSLQYRLRQNKGDGEILRALAGTRRQLQRNPTRLSSIGEEGHPADKTDFWCGHQSHRDLLRRPVGQKRGQADPGHSPTGRLINHLRRLLR